MLSFITSQRPLNPDSNLVLLGNRRFQSVPDVVTSYGTNARLHGLPKKLSIFVLNGNMNIKSLLETDFRFMGDDAATYSATRGALHSLEKAYEIF